MVPRISKSGRSFAKLAAYLLHDPDKAQTAERVLWTHTLNLASDDPGLAVHEMLWTYRAAEDLKREAGIKAGGRSLENPVRHFSLNWHPSETPSREHMIETVQGFLAHMKWERQALIVCHDDKHPHVHVMLNSVDPETGRAIDTSYEKRRAQAWALAYEREHQRIYCEERLKPADQRTPSPTRQTWQQLREFEREDDRTEQQRDELSYFDRSDTSTRRDREWKALKNYQREQREDFFASGKQAYREARTAAYGAVRKAMRGEWNKYHQARAAGFDKPQLAARKASLIQRQNQMLTERRHAATVVLRYYRDKEYVSLLEQQKAQRSNLLDRQRQGLTTYRLSDSTCLVEKRNARLQTERAQSMAKTHGGNGVALEKVPMAEQFRSAALALRFATDTVNSARQEAEAKHKQWRQHRAPSHTASSEPVERQAAHRSASEASQRRKEHEDHVRRAWNRARPVRARGRD